MTGAEPPRAARASIFRSFVDLKICYRLPSCSPYPSARSLLPNPVLLAPMSGITDAPFRRMVAGQGAGLVISEMTACAALAAGKRIAQRRVQKQGAGPHVVQLAGCEARWMAEGARIAADGGADIIDINMGCPAKNVTNGAVGVGADARPRSRSDADRGGGRRRRCAGDAENAARLG